jgi:hypothetical protein
MEKLRTVVTGIFGILLAASLVAITENFKELLRYWSGNTLLVRIFDKLLPAQWHATLSWKYLRSPWWPWLLFGLSGGFASALWLTDLFTPTQSHIGAPLQLGWEWKGLAGMSWGYGMPAPIYLYSVADNIYATDFFVRGMNVSDISIKLDDACRRRPAGVFLCSLRQTISGWPPTR